MSYVKVADVGSLNHGFSKMLLSFPTYFLQIKVCIFFFWFLSYSWRCSFRSLYNQKERASHLQNFYGMQIMVPAIQDGFKNQRTLCDHLLDKWSLFVVLVFFSIHQFDTQFGKEIYLISRRTQRNLRIHVHIHLVTFVL